MRAKELWVGGLAVSKRVGIMVESRSGRWLEKIRSEVEKARRNMEVERDRLVSERLLLEAKIKSLEQEMVVLDRLAMRAGAAPDMAGPERTPLSHRVLDVLHNPESELTSQELRRTLHLDQRESRNLGPVLNQLAKKGKLANAGRGAPWRRVS